MNIDLEALKQAALVASTGPWQIIQETKSYELWFPNGHLEVGPAIIGSEYSHPTQQDFADAAFIQAASPSFILALIERLELAESRNRKLMIGDYNTSACLFGTAEEVRAFGQVLNSWRETITAVAVEEYEAELADANGKIGPDA